MKVLPEKLERLLEKQKRLVKHREEKTDKRFHIRVGYVACGRSLPEENHSLFYVDAKRAEAWANKETA